MQAKERDLATQMRENYGALYKFNEKTRSLQNFSQSLDVTLKNKDSLGRLLQLTNSEQSIINLCGDNGDQQALPECNVESVNMTKIGNIKNRLIEATNQIDAITTRLDYLGSTSAL